MDINPEHSKAAWTDDNLDQMRRIGDLMGDNLMWDVMKLGEMDALRRAMRSLQAPTEAGQLAAQQEEEQIGTLGQTNALKMVMESLVHSDKPFEINTDGQALGENVDEINQILEAYIRGSEKMPKWADPEKIALAQQVFGANAPAIILILFCASLPFSYACKNGVTVLGLTRRLSSDHITHRILTTAQFIIDVMQPDGFKPGGISIRTIQKVRLIHASIRMFVDLYQPRPGIFMTYRPKWYAYDEEALGIAINQEDLVGTMLTFSVIVVEGLAALEIPLTDEEAEAYLHMWRVIGHMLGIQDEIMPASIAEAKALKKIILHRQQCPSFIGTSLTRELIRFMQKRIPTRFFNDMPAATIYRLLSEDLAELLDVPSPSARGKRAEGFVMRRLAQMIKLARRGDRRIHRVGRFNRFMVQAVINLWLRQHRASLEVPAYLRERKKQDATNVTT